MRLTLALALLVPLAFGCDDDGGEDTPEAAPGVPYAGEIAALPDGVTLDAQSFFPTSEGAIWRYRKKTSSWQDPPPVEQGGEAINQPGDTDDEFVRATTTIIDLEVDGEVVKVRQQIEETFIVVAASELVGPKVSFKSLQITERVVGSDAFVRSLRRDYLPPYLIFSDTWNTGKFDNNLNTPTRLEQSLQLAGDAEPDVTSGQVNVVVNADPQTRVLPMEGQYRDNVYEVQVFDDFSGQVVRTYWLEQGVGVVQWLFRDTQNISFTLTETNAAVAPALTTE